MKMNKHVLAALSAGVILVNGLGNAQALPPSGPLKISGDRGGYVIEYALRMLKLKQSHQRVEFRGSCDSACTLFLALPRHQTCVSPQSSFLFHKPYGAAGSGNQLALNYMLNAYPAWVVRWINKKGGLSNQPLSMSYSEASRFLPTCGGAGSAAGARTASN